MTEAPKYSQLHKMLSQIVDWQETMRNAMLLKKKYENGFVFDPFSGKQKQVLSWWRPTSGVSEADGIIADGSIRSGKTLSMSLGFIIWAMTTFNAQNFAMCGKTIGSFRRNVLFWLKLMCKTIGYSVSEHRSDNLVIIRNGSRENYFYLFGGKDERSQDLIQGITLAGVLFDEVALMPESFVNQATARCSVDGSKYWFNCNPDGPFHWFYVNWIKKAAERNLLYLHFTMDDNLSLSEKKKEQYKSQYFGVFFERYILGLWKLAEGLVYPQFNDEMIIDAVPTEAIDYGRWFVSIDYGTSHPFSCGLWCVYGKVAYRVREYYYDFHEHNDIQRTDEEHYADVEKLCNGIPVDCIIIDPSAASFKATVKRHGKYRTHDADNDVIDGIRVVSSMLVLGMMKICRCCTHCIMEFSVYSWNPKRTDAEIVIKEHDHAMDDTRYFAYTKLKKLFKFENWSG